MHGTQRLEAGLQHPQPSLFDANNKVQSRIFSGIFSRGVRSSLLDHQAVVAYFASYSLPVEIFQQRNSILSRQAGYLFKAGYVQSLPVKFAYLGAQAGKGFVVHEEILAAHLHQDFFAKQ